MSALLAAAEAALKQMCKVGCPGVDELDEAITAARAAAPSRPDAPEIAQDVRRGIQVLIDVSEERVRQDKQWGGPEKDDEKNVFDWCCNIGRQKDLLKTEGFFASDSADVRLAAARHRLVKIAALAVAAIESIDRKAAR